MIGNDISICLHSINSVDNFEHSVKRNVSCNTKQTLQIFKQERQKQNGRKNKIFGLFRQFLFTKTFYILNNTFRHKLTQQIGCYVSSGRKSFWKLKKKLWFNTTQPKPLWYRAWETLKQNIFQPEKKIKHKFHWKKVIAVHIYLKALNLRKIRTLTEKTIYYKLLSWIEMIDKSDIDPIATIS